MEKKQLERKTWLDGFVGRFRLRMGVMNGTSLTADSFTRPKSFKAQYPIYADLMQVEQGFECVGLVPIPGPHYFMERIRTSLRSVTKTE